MKSKTCYAYILLAGAVFLTTPSLKADENPGASSIQQLQLNMLKRKIDQGVSGKIYAYCDDYYVLYHNNKKVVEGYLNKPLPPITVKLKPGDILTVKATNSGGRNGFSLLFHNSNKTATFSTNSRDWYVFTPTNLQQWWQINDFAALEKQKPGQGSAQEYKGTIEKLAKLQCEECIWGDTGESTVFLTKEITYEDLMEK